MDRSRRIRIVAGIGLGLLSLLVAYVGVPLYGFLQHQANFGGADQFSLGGTGEISTALQDFTQLASQSQETASASIRIFLCAVMFAGICFAYVLVDIAIWFIGPPDDGPETSSMQAHT